MKPFYELTCPELASIRLETLAWLAHRSELIESKQFWNKIDTVDLLKNSPSLIKYCRTLGLRIREVAVLIASDNLGVGLHLDELPVTAKINFPILNTKHTRTEWYTIPKTDIEQLPVARNYFGKEIPDLSKVNINNYTKIGDIEMQGPIVFNSQIPHRVCIDSMAVLPRVVLSCMFFEEPTHLLQRAEG